MQKLALEPECKTTQKIARWISVTSSPHGKLKLHEAPMASGESLEFPLGPVCSHDDGKLSKMHGIMSAAPMMMASSLNAWHHELCSHDDGKLSKCMAS